MDHQLMTVLFCLGFILIGLSFGLLIGSCFMINGWLLGTPSVLIGIAGTLFVLASVLHWDIETEE